MEFDTAVDLSHLRRFALIADTHGPLHPDLIALISDHDCIVHAGDIGGLLALGVEERQTYAVAGNNDTPTKWAKSEARVLKALPQCINLQLLGGCLAVVHGHQYPVLKTRHQKLRAEFPDAKAILYGHSHRAVIDKSTKPWVLNPGAAGRVRAYGAAGFVSLETSKRGWRIEQIKLG